MLLILSVSSPYLQAFWHICRNTNREHRIHTEMSSFPETKAEKMMLSSCENMRTFLWYHEVQLSRVYPKAQRVGSDNYNPVPIWNVGSQMTALNFQTGDKPMQLNQAKFIQNGGCGYVLRPSYMCNVDLKYLPNDADSLPSSLTLLIGKSTDYVNILYRLCQYYVQITSILCTDCVNIMNPKIFKTLK